jgi:hypothetical protein
MEGLYCYHYITLIGICQLKGGIMAQEILKPLLLDETGKEIVAALNSVAEWLATLQDVVTQLTAIQAELQKQNQDQTTSK